MRTGLRTGTPNPTRRPGERRAARRPARPTTTPTARRRPPLTGRAVLLFALVLLLALTLAGPVRQYMEGQQEIAELTAEGRELDPPGRRARGADRAAARPGVDPAAGPRAAHLRAAR
ncbi:hypothetical protein [Blastococcus sp. TML/C7B]|uniref:hypothetical protein n=1 Tax=Blastococcus sp. TML/C7B TaxID=2798728 RepID=UPI001F5B3734|nr:hypothetical protein [Blastococcus sp. TML/C7B]